MTRSTVLRAQAGYYVATGVLPFFSRRAFERVTGPKLEWWLVLTVGALVSVVGGTLLAAARRPHQPPELLGLAAGSAAALAAIDVTYVARRRISPAYLVDAAAQAAILAGLATADRVGSRVGG